MILKERIQSLSHNKDAKALSINFISLTFLQVAGYIFPIITLPYLARVIGVDSFGEIAFAGSIVAYFSTFCDFGFNYTATRDVSKNRNNSELVSKIFSNVFFAKILLMTVSMVIFAICIYSIPFLFARRVLLWLTFLYIPGNIMFPEWFFQAMERMTYITVMNLFSKLLFTVLVFVVIKEKSDYILQPVLYALGYLLSGIISLWILFKKFGVKLILPPITEIINSIKNSWNVFVSIFLPNLYSSFSVILLRTFGGDVATGLYSSGMRFIVLFTQFSDVLSRTFYPFLARRLDKHSLYVKISGTLNILASLTLFLSADLLIKIFYTEEFTASATVIRIMAISLLFLFLLNTYGNNYLMLIGKENVLKNIITVCSILGCIISCIMVINFNYIGVAITMTLTRGMIGVTVWYYANRAKKKMEIINKIPVASDF